MAGNMRLAAWFAATTALAAGKWVKADLRLPDGARSTQLTEISFNDENGHYDINPGREVQPLMQKVTFQGPSGMSWAMCDLFVAAVTNNEISPLAKEVASLLSIPDALKTKAMELKTKAGRLLDSGGRLSVSVDSFDAGGVDTPMSARTVQVSGNRYCVLDGDFYRAPFKAVFKNGSVSTRVVLPQRIAPQDIDREFGGLCQQAFAYISADGMTTREVTQLAGDKPYGMLTSGAPYDDGAQIQFAQVTPSWAAAENVARVGLALKNLRIQ